MTNDPFEEFEFRPITEGLGFHRHSDRKQSPSLESKRSLPEIEMPLSPRSIPEKAPDHLKQPARRSTTEEPKAKDTAAVDEILKSLQAKRKIDFQEKESKVEPEAPVAAYRTTTPDLSAYVLDGMLVTAATLACMIILLMVTKVDLFGVISQTDDPMVYVSLYALFGGVAWIYLVVNRMFMGHTPGEWVFDQRVGHPQDQSKASYLLHVMGRATLVVLTGLLPLPLLSLIMGRDLAGQISGAPLLKKV